MPSHILNAVIYTMGLLIAGLGIALFNLYGKYSDLEERYQNSPSFVVMDWTEIVNIEDEGEADKYMNEAKTLLAQLTAKNAIVLDSRYVNAAPSDVIINLDTLKKRHESATAHK